jgi:arylsulfatase A-like enzyme
LIKKQIPINRVASLIDAAPTICDLLGLPSPDACQGDSLLKPNHLMALFVTDYSLGYLGLHDGTWKFIHELESGRSKLFNVSVDPKEKMNRANQFPALVSKYKDRLLRWSAAQKDLIARRARGNGKEEETVVSSLRMPVNGDYVHSR